MLTSHSLPGVSPRHVANFTASVSGTFGALLLRIVGATHIWWARRKIAALPVVGGLASIPTRAADLRRVIDSILPQVDRLHVFLHGYSTVPQDVVRPGVIVHLAPADHPYRTAGKFYGLTQETAACIYCTFDDDIDYRPGHVARLRAAILRYGGRAVVGLQAATFSRSPGGYLARMRSRGFARGLWFDQRADEIGTGTSAFLSTALRLDPANWPQTNMDDLMLAIDAEAQGLPRIGIARPAGSIVAIRRNQPDSIKLKVKHDDSLQSAQLARLEAMTRRWPRRSPAPVLARQG